MTAITSKIWVLILDGMFIIEKKDPVVKIQTCTKY